MRRLLVALVVPAALGAAAMFPAAASAYSRGFHVYNLSSHPIRLLNITGDGDFEGRPPDGSVLQPGEGYQDIELKWYAFYNEYDHASYAVLGDDGQQIGTFVAFMRTLAGPGAPFAYCHTSLGACSPAEEEQGATLALYDHAGTQIDVPKERGQQQAAALKQLCSESNLATCSFTATKREHVYSPPHQVGKALINETDESQETKVIAEDEVGTTDSVGVEVSVGGTIASIVELELKAKYQHKWTVEHTFKQETPVECKPHHKCWIDEVNPMLRDTGDFTLTLGHTTWHLHDVYFDSPDPNPDGTGGAYIIRECELGTSGCSDVGEKLGGSPPRMLSGRYTVPPRMVASPPMRPRLALRIAGPARVTPGRRASYRITVSRRRPAHRVVYALGDVVVRGRVGHRVRQWRPGSLRRRVTRTMRMNVAVPRSAHGRFCMTVHATAAHARSGRARKCVPVGAQTVGETRAAPGG